MHENRASGGSALVNANASIWLFVIVVAARWLLFRQDSFLQLVRWEMLPALMGLGDRNGARGTLSTGPRTDAGELLNLAEKTPKASGSGGGLPVVSLVLSFRTRASSETTSA